MNTNSPPVIKREQALAFRLDSQNLGERLPGVSLLLAAGACGLQNTPPGSAQLALHARVDGLTPGLFNRALIEDKSLLQSWSLRASPTIFPTVDAAVFRQGVCPRNEEEIRHFIPGVEAALATIGISATEAVELASAALVEILDGRGMTKDELGLEISRWLVPRFSGTQAAAWGSPSWYASGQNLGESVVRFALPVLALQGLCCHADRKGNQARLMLTHQWLGARLPVVDVDWGRAELARRYLHAYGPSTPEHLAEWSGISVSQASQTWALVESELVEVDFAGRKTWLMEGDFSRLLSPPNPEEVRLLPPHDPYLGMRDRETLVQEKALQRRIWRSSGNPGVVLVDGQLVGLWRPKKRGERLGLVIESFSPLAYRVRSRIETEAEMIALQRGCTRVSLEFVEVEAPHS